MPDHTPGLQHSSVVFYLNPDSAQGHQFCCKCNRYSVVKLIDIRQGSITEEQFLCQMCYLCHLILLSANMYGFISTECGKALCMSGGLPVDDCEKEIVSIPNATGYSPFPHFNGLNFNRITMVQTTESQVNGVDSNKSTAPTTATNLYIYIKRLIRSRRSRTAKGRYAL